MITRNIETLRTKSLPFDGTPEELENLFTVLEFELTHNPNSDKGVGLSGIQINVPYQVAIIRTATTKLDLYNAKVTKQEQPYVFEGEGCLSVPGETCNTKRFNIIEIVNGDGKELKLSGFDAVVVQHELGHWNGEVFLDYKTEEKKK